MSEDMDTCSFETCKIFYLNLYYNNVSSIAFPDIPLKSISEIYMPLTRFRIPIFSLRFKVVFH